jgi:hypothetical protein
MSESPLPADTQEQKKRGRKSTEEEVRDFLSRSGLDADRILSGTDADVPMPDTFEGLRDEFLKIAWSKRNDMTDTAFTQMMNALARLAEANKQADDAVKGEEPLIADVISGIAALPAERRREILTGALTDLDAERARIVEVLSA